MQPHQYNRVTLTCAVIGAFLLGLLLGQLDWVHSVGLAMISAMALYAFRGRRFALPFALLLALCLGIWRGEVATLQKETLTRYVGEKVVLTGTVSDDPTISAKQTAFSIDNPRVNGQPATGSLSVTSYRIDLKRGYKVKITGKLKPGFGAKDASIGYGQLFITSQKLSALERLRQGFFAGMHTALPDPLASLALGLLIGARALIPRWLQVELSNVGLSHLVAVSGYNLTIVAAAVYRIVRPRSRNLATISSLWLIAAFVLVAGASASVVRAALVAVLTLVASLRGRKFEPLVLIAIAAALTAAWRPSYIANDLGWQLSFLAFFGIAVVAPRIVARLPKKPNPIQQLFIEAFSAQITTWPLIAYVFHQFSMVALVSNMLIMPLVPLAMAGSFVAGLVGMLMPLAAGWVAWPASLLLHWMIAAISWLSAVSGSVVPVTLTLGGLIWAYGLIIAWTLLLSRPSRRTKVST